MYLMDQAEPVRSARQPLAPGHAVGITEAMIEAVVHGFYDRIRQDPALGPIFNRTIAPEAWPAHLRKMCDFWSSVMLMSGRFKGAPMAAHIRIAEIRPTHSPAGCTCSARPRASSARPRRPRPSSRAPR